MEPFNDTSVDQRQTFGSYRLDRHVKSSGSLGIYQATYLPKARPVLLYVTSPTATEADVAAFRADRAVVLTLAHRNLAPIADFGTIDDRHYIAFQLSGSTPLAAARGGSGSELAFVGQVTEALSYLHQNGVARGSFAADEVYLEGNTALLVPLGSRRFADFTGSESPDSAPADDPQHLDLLSVAQLLSRGDDWSTEAPGDRPAEGVGRLGATVAGSLIDRVRGLGPLKPITTLSEFRSALSEVTQQKVAAPIAPPSLSSTAVQVTMTEYVNAAEQAVAAERATESVPAPAALAKTPPERSVCQHCGFANTGDSRFCAVCGHSLDAAFEESAPGNRRDVQRLRPLWLTFTLSVVTFGLYNFWWFFATWRELKREIRDPGMAPFWHTIALVVPIANLFVIYRHFEVINEQLNLVKKDPMLHSGWMIVAILISGVIRVAENRTEGVLSWVLYALTGLTIATLITLGQRALNGYFQAIPGRFIRTRTHPFEWITLALGVAWVILTAIGEIFAEAFAG